MAVNRESAGDPRSGSARRGRAQKKVFQLEHFRHPPRLPGRGPHGYCLLSNRIRSQRACSSRWSAASSKSLAFCAATENSAATIS